MKFVVDGTGDSMGIFWHLFFFFFFQQHIPICSIVVIAYWTCTEYESVFDY